MILDLRGKAPNGRRERSEIWRSEGSDVIAWMIRSFDGRISIFDLRRSLHVNLTCRGRIPDYHSSSFGYRVSDSMCGHYHRFHVRGSLFESRAFSSGYQMLRAPRSSFDVRFSVSDVRFSPKISPKLDPKGLPEVQKGDQT